MAVPRPGFVRLALGAVVGIALGVSLAALLPRSDAPPPPPPPEPFATDAKPLEPVFDEPDTTRDHIDVTLVPMVAGIGQPTELAFVPGHPELLVVTSKWGSIHLVDFESGLREYWMWLDVLDELECGILGFAFHPEFERNGRFFVSQVPRDRPVHTSVVSEFRVNPRTMRKPRHVADLIEVPQPTGTHNGGKIAFGPDGMLFFGLGDGSAGGDPFSNGQDTTTFLGSMLRLDVSERGRYTVPPDNPFVDDPNVRPEIWAYGLRNPWRFSFDPLGRLIAGDVGQSRFEEVDIVEAGDNLGWRYREGPDCYVPPEGCPDGGMTDAIYVYGRNEGASITGGVVARSADALRGHYVFGDFVTGRLWAMQLPLRREPVDRVLALGTFDVSPTAFALDPQGRVWLADFRSEIVFRIDTKAR